MNNTTSLTMRITRRGAMARDEQTYCQTRLRATSNRGNAEAVGPAASAES
jgi:hypothetical protein